MTPYEAAAAARNLCRPGATLFHEGAAGILRMERMPGTHHVRITETERTVLYVDERGRVRDWHPGPWCAFLRQYHCIHMLAIRHQPTWGKT